MAKRMQDGEIRAMKPEAWGANNIWVLAERVDSETPYVILKLMDHVGHPAIYLTDAQAEELCKRIKRALSILPTSK